MCVYVCVFVCVYVCVFVLTLMGPDGFHLCAIFLTLRVSGRNPYVYGVYIYIYICRELNEEAL